MQKSECAVIVMPCVCFSTCHHTVMEHLITVYCSAQTFEDIGFRGITYTPSRTTVTRLESWRHSPRSNNCLSSYIWCIIWYQKWYNARYLRRISSPVKWIKWESLRDNRHFFILLDYSQYFDISRVVRYVHCSRKSQNFGSNYALFFITVAAISLHHISSFSVPTCYIRAGHLMLESRTQSATLMITWLIPD